MDWGMYLFYLAASLHLVGSSCNGFASKTSDADFCLMLTQWRRVIYFLPLMDDYSLFTRFLETAHSKQAIAIVFVSVSKLNAQMEQKCTITKDCNWNLKYCYWFCQSRNKVHPNKRIWCQLEYVCWKNKEVRAITIIIFQTIWLFVLGFRQYENYRCDFKQD